MANWRKEISKVEFYSLGAFANSNLYRKADASGEWHYFQILDNGA